MKKAIRFMFVALCCAMTMQALVSCSGVSSSPVDEALGIVDDAIAKMKATDDAMELIGIINTAKADLNAFNAAHKDYEPTSAEKERIQAKLREFQETSVRRAYEIPLGNTAQGQQAKEMLDKMFPKSK